MGRFKRSKKVAQDRNQKLRSIQLENKVKSIKSRSKSAFNSGFEILTSGYLFKITYKGHLFCTCDIEEYHISRDCICIKEAVSGKWLLYYKTQKVAQSQDYNGFFFASENGKIFYNKDQGKDLRVIECQSYFKTFDFMFCFKLNNGLYRIAESGWRGDWSLYFIKKPKAHLVYLKRFLDNTKPIDAKIDAFVSLGGGVYKKLDKITPRMNFCKVHHLPYYTGVNRLRRILDEIHFFIS